MGNIRTLCRTVIVIRSRPSHVGRRQSLDQAGVGQSTLISCDYPTPPPGFNQVPEPCYIWNNTTNGAPCNTFSPETANIKQGIHYFNNTALPG
jgi:hypothetical protein